MQEYFSEFNPDNSLLQSMLDTCPDRELVRGAKELAVALNLRLACKRNEPHSFRFYTPRGLYAGALTHSNDYTSSNNEKFFMYDNPTMISKEKASTRSHRGARDSHKITGIINALKKNKEIPDDVGMMSKFGSSLQWAFRSGIERNTDHRVDLDLETSQIYALLKAFIENNKSDAEANREILTAKYEEYLDTLRRNKEHKKDGERFRQGTFVGMIPDPVRNEATMYVVGEADHNNGNILVGDWKRYKSLADSPIAHIAMMIRESRRGKDDFMEENELGLPRMDKFYEDLDIATGWTSTRNGTWVVIPKHGT